MVLLQHVHYELGFEQLCNAKLALSLLPSRHNQAYASKPLS